MSDVSGRAWVAPSSGGLLWIRGAEQHSITGLGLEQDEIYSISGGPGEVWLGRKLGGVTRLREQDGILRAQTYTAADGLAPGIVHAVYRARDETVWAGTLTGAISRIRNGRITTFTSANGLTADAVNTIDETPDGVIWAGTAGGLNAFRNGNWRRYSGEDGLPPRGGEYSRGRSARNSLDRLLGGIVLLVGYADRKRAQRSGFAAGPDLGLAADGAGGLWASTDRNVAEISRASLLGKSNAGFAAREFGIADGLPSTRGIKRDHAAVNEPSGRIWFCLQDGVSVVNPSRPGVLAPALVHVESVVVDGRPLDTGSAARYPSNRQRVVFNFVGLSLAVPGRVRYRYLLEGYDHNWSEPTESREAAYANLPPARYTFRVMATNSEGLWNGSPASVSLEVAPMLWQTWWFRVIALGLLGAASLGRLPLPSRTRPRSHKSALRGAARGKDPNCTGTARYSAARIHQRVHAGARSSGHDAGGRGDSTTANARSAADETSHRGRPKYSPGTARERRFRTARKRPFHIEEELGGSAERRLSSDRRRPTARLHPLLQDEVYRIGREALINAFRHAQARHIGSRIGICGSLRLFVRDDGVGIDEHVLEAGREGHWGLRGMRERAERIGAEFHVFSRPSAGTEIRLDVPSTVAFRAGGK